RPPSQKLVGFSVINFVSQPPIVEQRHTPCRNRREEPWISQKENDRWRNRYRTISPPGETFFGVRIGRRCGWCEIDQERGAIGQVRRAHRSVARRRGSASYASSERDRRARAGATAHRRKPGCQILLLAITT